MRRGWRKTQWITEMFRRDLIKGAGLCALLGTHERAAFSASGAQAGGPYEWKSVPFGAGGFIDGFVFHPRERGLLYARTDIGGVYRFDPAAKSWLPLLDHLPKADADLMGVLSLAVDPNDPDRLYAACGLYLDKWSRNGALLASSNRGASWQIHELGIKLGGNAAGRGTGERLQVDPHQGEILLLGTTQDGLMKSTDRGRSFSRLGFPGKHVSLVLFDPRSGAPGTACRSVYAGSHDKPGLYASHDAGQSFEREPGTPEQVPQRAVFGPDGTLYVTFALGGPEWPTNPGNARIGSVCKRDRDGRWTDITPTRPANGEQGFGYAGLDVDPKVPGRILVSTIERWAKGDDIFMSTDNGAQWMALGARSRHEASGYQWLVDLMRSQDKMGHWIADIKIDPFNGERAIYGTGYGLWLTQNLGAAQQGGTVNWNFAVANLEETATLELKSPSGGATLLAAMGDVSGGAWDDVTKTPGAGLFKPNRETNRSVDFSQLDPRVIARTADQAATGGYTSVDGGVSWRPFGPSPRVARSQYGGPAETGRVAVSAKGTSFVWVPEQQAALFSHDRGRTWKVSEGWPDTRDVSLMPVADRTVDGVFYVHDRAKGQILASADAGQSFKPAIVGLPELQGWQSAQLVCAPGVLRDLWLALPNVLLHLPGPEQPVKTIKTVAEPWMIALGKGAAGAAYHSLYVWGRVSTGGAPTEGLFRSDDGGASFKRINDDRHRYGRLLSMTADPLEHGTVYLAPHGRGIVVGRPAGRGAT